MKNLLVASGDTGQGDFIEESTILDDKQLAFVRRVADLIKTVDASYNWGTFWEALSEKDLAENVYADVLTEDEIEEFTGLLPYGDQGITNIRSLTIYKVTESEELL